MIDFFQNVAGAITWTTSTGVAQGTKLPDEAGGTGAPEAGAAGALAVGNHITFNNLSSPQSANLTGVGNELLEEGEGPVTQTYIYQPLFGHPAGTQINTGYAVVLTDGVNTYKMYAVSFGVNNDNPGPNGVRDYTDMFIFEGAKPPAGVQLTVSQVINIASFNYAGLVCFAGGTQIATFTGQRPVEELKVGDLVWSWRTGRKKLERIRWIGRRRVGRAELLADPRLLPVRIAAGALGGLPDRDLLVSRQHRILVGRPPAQAKAGAGEALVPAITLTCVPGVTVDESVQHIEYFHILFDQHEIIKAEGLMTESLFTGAKALAALSPAAREEIFTLFPELATDLYQPKPARPLLKGSEARRFVGLPF